MGAVEVEGCRLSLGCSTASEAGCSREGEGDAEASQAQPAAGTLPDLALLLIFKYVAAYNLDDAVSAGQVCRHWRRVARSAELWRHLRLRGHGLATQAFTRVVAFAPRLRALDVCWIHQVSPQDRAVRKAALLGSRCKLTCLTGVMCHRDPQWAHRLLALHGPHLRELEVSTADRGALEAIGVMPHLRVLQVSGWDAELLDQPVVFPADGGPTRLETLEVRGLPRSTTTSMLRACRGSLRSLQLGVGTSCAHASAPAPDPDPWPRTCQDLTQVLQDCSLIELRELILYRFVGCYHTMSECAQQRNSLQQSLRFCKIKCSDCSPYNL
ncbi:F-box/WD repeat-containing protein 12 [Frankliniella fusca]|uniref:F-box/WD repeat-containing protein 12 n=1 Tax=Frankliniella fusca TaxID=407009 RepID=A0AAE1I0Q7_9NEOP|nr:F-box/WD repeat-containing protein 12 [Frankliniella fusca]